MDDHGKNTRKDKFEKRRKNTKSISILLIVSVILLLSLIGIWLFGGGSNEAVDEVEQVQADNNDNEKEEDLEEEITDETKTNANVEPVEESDTNTIEETDSTDVNEETNKDVVKEQVEPTDDNVREAFVGDWDPVGTEQEGPHTVNYNNDSVDRLEMREAILTATGLIESDYHEWWIGNGGDQKIIATVSDAKETEIYRVYLSWIENEGWQPTKVELLIENDWQKYQ